MTKYLTEKEINQIIGEIVLDKSFRTMSQDSYNEQLIALKIAKLNPTELCYAAINMATVGFGNQKYGQFRLGEDIVNISNLLLKSGIKINNAKSAILKDDDITAQRLCRFYRHQIRKYIIDYNVDTYMYRKYSTRIAKFKHICFRGAEYLEGLSREEQEFLLETVANMDDKLGINVRDRVLRVFEAKNNYQILKPV